MSDAGTTIRIDWDGCRRAEWDRLAARTPFCPVEQGWLYGEAYARGGTHTVRRAVILANGAPTAIAQIFHRRMGGLLTLAQILRGPVLLDGALPVERVAALYRCLKAESRRGGGRQVLFWTPELPEGDAAAATMRACGLRQVLTGYGSAQLDLTPEEPALRAALHGKWRNALVRAEAAPVRTETAAGGIAVPWLLERYAALRRKRRFGGPSPAILAHILAHAAPRDVVLLRAFSGSAPVAGALFLRHGQGASYLVGWADETSRSLNAGTLLLWRGLLELGRRGTRLHDLGGIDTRRTPGIARFKLGVGGGPYRLAGTFV